MSHSSNCSLWLTFLSLLIFLIFSTHCWDGLYVPAHTRTLIRYAVNISAACPGPKWPQDAHILDIARHHPLIVEDGGAFGASVDRGGDIECHWLVRNAEYAEGIVVVVQGKHLNSKGREDSCEDYVLFQRYNGTDTVSGSKLRKQMVTSPKPARKDSTKICLSDRKIRKDGSKEVTDPMPGGGTSEAGNAEPYDMMGHLWGHFLRNGAFIYAGETFLTTVHIGKRRYSQPEEPQVSFRIVYTPYMKCGRYARLVYYDFDCGHELCISKLYKGDGVVNCPFYDCADEGGCNPEKINVTLSKEKEYKWPSYTRKMNRGPALYIIFGVTFGAFIIIILFCVHVNRGRGGAGANEPVPS